MSKIKRIKRDIVHAPDNPNLSYPVEAVINKYCDSIQPLWEQMRNEVEALGYKIHVETAISDGKLEVGYRKK